MADEDLTPREAYCRIIDELVERTPGVTGARIVEHGHYSPNSDGDSADFNALVESLSPQQCDVLARLCVSERHGGIHDALAAISWWIDCGGLTFHLREEEMPVDISGMGLHGDYVGRSQDWPWPGED